MSGVSVALQEPEPPLVEVSSLSVGLVSRAGRPLPILRAVDLMVGRGEVVGLVGESGSGKSTLLLALMGYLRPGLRWLGGRCRFAGLEVFDIDSGLDSRRIADLRGGRVALVPQHAAQALGPSMTVGDQVVESIALHTATSRSHFKESALDLLERVRLPAARELFDRYPHQLSGGQQQRVLIAMALASEPELLLLDEPTSGLDVTTQAELLDTLSELSATARLSMVCVSHDLGAIARLADRIAVLYAGELVEVETAAQLLDSPGHPYTRGLLRSMPRAGAASRPLAMAGQLPALGVVGAGCSFADRCPVAESRCREVAPALERSPNGGAVRCHLAGRLPESALPAARGHFDRERRSARGLLRIADLSASYRRSAFWKRRRGGAPTRDLVLDSFALEIAEGEKVAVLGESGSGKSTLLRVVAGLLAPTAGEVILSAAAGPRRLEPTVEGRDRDSLRRIQLVFQNPKGSLNPRHTVAEILARPLELYFDLSRTERRDRVEELLARVRLGAHHRDRLPSQLSGGEQQRVAIARAFAAKPDLVLCDEVTSALDVSVQASILDLLERLGEEQGTSYLFVSHDLAVVGSFVDRAVVLYQGRMCESGPTDRLFEAPLHPYTRTLFDSAAAVGDRAGTRRANDAGARPAAAGCHYRDRCPLYLGALCAEVEPPWQDAGEGRAVRCHIPVESLPTSRVRAW